MPAQSPEQICQLFQQYMAEGDIEALLSIYDPEAVFLNRSGEVKQGRQGLREELAPFAPAKAIFDFSLKQIVQSGDIALMHTLWTVSSPQTISVYAIEVARCQPDGAWCWLIGDPFTVGRRRHPDEAV
jgi:ketosteroid isomerase-like protein